MHTPHRSSRKPTWEGRLNAASAIRDTRSPLAVQYIRSACNWLVVNGDSLLNASSKGYYICLVRQLSGAQSNEAAAAIMSACRTSNPL